MDDRARILGRATANADFAEDADASTRSSSAEWLPRSDITASISGAFFDVYREPKYGLSEGLYAAALEMLRTEQGLEVKREAIIDVEFRGQDIANYRADFVAEIP